MRYRQGHERASSHRAFALLSAAIVATGIALRARQYLGRSSLWTDEAALANNIVTRSLSRLLFAPLDHNQAAPAGFLLIEKLATSLFGANELALRAFPFACSVIALLVLWRIATRLLSDAGAPLVLAPFALAPVLIFHAAEAKQYSSDIAIALDLLLLALELDSQPVTRRRVAAAAAAGMMAVWFSQPAVLIAAGIGAALIAWSMMSRERGSLAPVAIVVSAWAVSAAAAVAVSVDHLAPASHRYMSTFWGDGFWPMTLDRAEILTWPVLRIASTLGNQLSLPRGAALGCTALVIAGVWGLCRSDKRAAMLLTAPLLVTLGASAARLYPFSERLVLFLIPSLLLLLAAGISTIADVLAPKRLALAAVTAAMLVLTALDARALRDAPPVYRREEIAPAVAYLRTNTQPGDLTYVYYGGVPAFEFYARERLDSASYVIGRCHRGDPRQYLLELDVLRGRPRAWLLFAHELPRLRERALLLRYLDAIAGVRDSVIVRGRDLDGQPTSVSLYLYDLSDSVRLASASARSFPIDAQPAIDERLRCQQESSGTSKAMVTPMAIRPRGAGPRYKPVVSPRS